MPIQSQQFKLTSNISMVWDAASQRLMLIDSENNTTSVFVPEHVINDSHPTNDSKSVNMQFRSVSDLGAPGDKQGDICVDATNMYICFANYTDGTNAIWRKIPLTEI
jgi:hypothetical protein